MVNWLTLNWKLHNKNIISTNGMHSREKNILTSYIKQYIGQHRIL